MNSGKSWSSCRRSDVRISNESARICRVSKTDEERQQVAEAHKEVGADPARHQRGKRGPRTLAKAHRAIAE